MTIGSSFCVTDCFSQTTRSKLWLGKQEDRALQLAATIGSRSHKRRRGDKRTSSLTSKQRSSMCVSELAATIEEAACKMSAQQGTGPESNGWELNRRDGRVRRIRRKLGGRRGLPRAAKANGDPDPWGFPSGNHTFFSSSFVVALRPKSSTLKTSTFSLDSSGKFLLASRIKVW